MPWTDTRITRMLGLDHPIVQGAFGGGMSSVALAAAVSNGGGLGSFGAHHLGGDAITALVGDLRAATDRSFAVNLWVPIPGEPTELDHDTWERAADLLAPWFARLGIDRAPFAPRQSIPFEEQVDAVLAAAPPVFSFVFGVPSPEILADAKRRGILTLGTATNLDEGRALDDAGVDIVVASGYEAGGHRTSFLRPALDSLATGPLTAILSSRLKAPVVAAGGIANGRGIASALVLGAEAAQLGTAFLATDESGASPAHRAALLDSRAETTALTRAFSGRWARGIRNEMLDELEPHEADVPAYPLQQWVMQEVKVAAVAAGDSDAMSLWAGQGAPLLPGPRTAHQTLEDLVAETNQIFAGLSR